MSGSEAPIGMSTGGGTTDDECGRIRLDRKLEAPNPERVEGLAVGDVLDVILLGEAPQVVAVVDTDNVAIGTIVPTAQLMGCLNRDFDFSAQVTSIDGGYIMLRISAA